MANLRKCEFFLLRYVPDAVKDEFVNIGVLMLDAEAAAGQQPFSQVRFTDDWSRVRCIDPAADIEVLEGFGEAVRTELARGHEGREWLLKKLNDSFSNVIQIAPAKACLTENPQQEVELLSKLYLQSPSRKSETERNVGSRARIVSEMRDAFEAVGVWRLMWKKIPAADYTQGGDPLKIDCGYKPNGTIKMFHALALDNEIDSAKVLAFSYPAIKEGIARKLKAKTELTAIINRKQSANDSDTQVAFALETLAAADIHVATVAQLGQVAEAARRDMRL
jgi:DUF3037 family protein